MVNQEAGQFPCRLSPYHGLSDHPLTPQHHTASPTRSVQDPSAPDETHQSQESNPPASPRVSVDLMPYRLEGNPVTPLQALAPTATSTQTDVANESISASPKHGANRSYGDQPRRLSARKSKSVYRRPESQPQLIADNIPETSDTCSPTCQVPAEGHKETDKKTSEQLSKNQLDINQNDREEAGMTQRLKNQCEVCELVLSSASALKHHWKVHGAGRDSVCEMCGKIFPNDRSLRSHLLIHTLGKCSDDGATTKTEEADFEINQEILELHQNSPQDQPRRLSARKSKSVYRRPVDLESPQPSSDDFQETNDTSASTCLVPTKVLKKTDNSFKYISRDQLDKNQDDGDAEQRQKNQCEVCELVLDSASALKQHWKVHRAETDSVCYRCGKIFPNDRSLRCHLFIHTLGKRRKRSEDEAVTKSEQADCKIGQEVLGLDQNTHQDQPRRLSARKSKSVYRRPMDMDTTQLSVENIHQTKTPGLSAYHIATTEVHKKRDKKSFRQSCKKRSYKNRQGSIHRLKNQCELCGRILCSAASLLHHLKVHRGERPFVCDRCGKGFAFQKGLIRHLQTHNLAKYNQCSAEVGGVPKAENVDCQIDQQSLRLFQNSHQGQATRSSVRKSKSVYRRWVNLETDDTSASTSNFREVHKEANEKIADSPSGIQVNEHQCGFCGMFFINATSLLFHQRVHRERPFACDQCGKAFPEEQDLRRHTVIHTRDKRYQCLQCDRTFPYRCLLTRHQVRHTGEAAFPCVVCGKRFASKVSLVTHTRVHTVERPHSCTLCDKVFAKREALKAHMLHHRGEKPYSCLTCGKRFGHRCSLKIHERIHTGEKPFECRTCGMAFRQSANLRYHVSKRHTSLSHSAGKS